MTSACGLVTPRFSVTAVPSGSLPEIVCRSDSARTIFPPVHARVDPVLHIGPKIVLPLRFVRAHKFHAHNFRGIRYILFELKVPRPFYCTVSWLHPYPSQTRAV
jgi:hypothetical protein